MKKRRTYKRSDNCEIVNLTVSFNIKDPHQLALLETAEAMPNFSASVKRFLDGRTVPDTPRPALPAERPEPRDEVPEQQEFDPVSAFL